MARILVIDDNDDVRAVSAGVLEGAGHEVVGAPDGARGMDLQRQSPAAVVITDILMPEKDGIEMIRDLREEFPTVKIIAMSGLGKRVKDTSPYLSTAKEIGAHLILRKPFTPSVLLDSVQEMLKPSTK